MGAYNVGGCHPNNCNKQHQTKPSNKACGTSLLATNALLSFARLVLVKRVVFAAVASTVFYLHMNTNSCLSVWQHKQ